MAAAHCDCDRLFPMERVGVFPPRATSPWAVVFGGLGPLTAALGALWSLPGHGIGSWSAAPVVFFLLTAVAKAGLRMRRGGGRRGWTGEW